MRSAATQEKLLTATLESLLENGYTRTSTTGIVERAGVSRGALTHHYPAKEDLVAAALQKSLRNATKEIRSLAQKVQTRELLLDDFLDHLWRLFSGPFFFISLEMVVECRHNVALRERMVPVIREFHAALDSTWSQFFRRSRLSPMEIDTTLNMTACLLRGMGVQTVLRPEPRYYARLLAGWKAQLAQIMEANETAPAASGRQGASPARSVT